MLDIKRSKLNKWTVVICQIFVIIWFFFVLFKILGLKVGQGVFLVQLISSVTLKLLQVCMKMCATVWCLRGSDWSCRCRSSGTRGAWQRRRGAGLRAWTAGAPCRRFRSWSGACWPADRRWWMRRTSPRWSWTCSSPCAPTSPAGVPCAPFQTRIQVFNRWREEGVNSNEKLYLCLSSGTRTMPSSDRYLKWRGSSVTTPLYPI